VRIWSNNPKDCKDEIRSRRNEGRSLRSRSEVESGAKKLAPLFFHL